MKKQNWNELKEQAERYRTDKDRNLLLTWAGGQSHMIEVWDEQGQVVALSTIDHSLNEVPAKRIVNHMRKQIRTGNYNWV